jgi:hypothetical protein
MANAMNLQLAKNTQTHKEISASDQSQREQIKQEIQQRIHETLQVARDLPSNDCLSEVRSKLLAVQLYCQSVGKTFIFIEECITCAQYDLGGHHDNKATLFRGPSEAASVAICVTHEGSLLHRNDCPWKIYRHMRDVNPVEHSYPHKPGENLN